ncbi:MAG: hypothetical protein QOG38_430, partial [Hyphomicrobiales bacterium]|nr:hypothetical protein [Hyphomicrobiales bacterium]
TIQNRIRAWCEEIAAGKKKKRSGGPIDPNLMSVSDLLSLMTVRTGAYVLAAAAFIFSAGMVAYPIVSQIRAKLGV